MVIQNNPWGDSMKTSIRKVLIVLSGIFIILFAFVYFLKKVKIIL